MTRRSVLIVGCGIAGPALAYWLLEHGFQPTLVERAPAPRREGYAIDFWGLGYDLVERMGVLPQVLDAGFAMRELRLVDGRGRRVGGFDADVFRMATGGRFTTLPRGALSEVLFKAIEGRAEVRWATTPTALEQRADGVFVQFNNGRSEVFRCAVGADGAHSTVREKIFGELACERYLGFRVAAFEAANYPKRDEHAYVSHAAPGRQMARISLRDNRTLFLLVAREDELGPKRWERRDTLDYMHARFHDLGWEAQDMLAAADGVQEIYIDRVSQITLRRWWRGHAALVGDAAYAPSLLAGQGSALAIIGAYVLAGELSRSVTPESAFERYQQTLGAFILRKQDAATKFAGTFVPKTRLGIWLRNTVTRAMAVPAIARLAMGDSLKDDFDLPDYSRRDAATTTGGESSAVLSPRI